MRWASSLPARRDRMLASRSAGMRNAGIRRAIANAHRDEDDP
jgi:hypothetical protein